MFRERRGKGERTESETAFFSMLESLTTLLRPYQACRTGVMFCAFQASRGKREASADCALAPARLKNAKKITPVLQASLIGQTKCFECSRE